MVDGSRTKTTEPYLVIFSSFLIFFLMPPFSISLFHFFIFLFFLSCLASCMGKAQITEPWVHLFSRAFQFQPKCSHPYVKSGLTSKHRSIIIFGSSHFRLFLPLRVYDGEMGKSTCFSFFQFIFTQLFSSCLGLCTVFGKMCWNKLDLHIRIFTRPP